jgi:5-methylcytosine-specific restriction endonuclease McrA
VTLPSPNDLTPPKFRLSYQAREIYGLLYETRESPLSMREIRERLAHIGTQEQLDRRRRELNRYFEIEKVGTGAETAYRLVAAKERPPEADQGISERDRAAVLRHGRCAMCGRMPLDDAIKLQVDHRIPQGWGGTDALENLQPLCEECNRGKKNLFASFDDHAPAIRASITHESVHARIGELLKALQGEWVRSDLIDVVASPPGDYQEDWQKRLRELRVLGWEIETHRRKEDGRSRAFYRLTKSQPWPDGNIRQAIRRAEQQRGY